MRDRSEEVPSADSGSEDLAAAMRAANRGDAAAYRRVLDGLASRLRGFVRRNLARIGRGQEDCEDIVQETLLAVHLKRHTWDETQALEPWARAIAHHKFVDALRRRGFQQHVPIEDYADSPELAVSAAPDQRASSDLLALLPERQRRIVAAISIEGHSAREVGARLAMSEGAVRVALHRALRFLAEALRREES